ncbi:MAG: hypothetical protein ACK56W_25750 [Pirellula sp.]|jgi:hypothetical protein|nr:hypothetical protein [Pirellula sp.]
MMLIAARTAELLASNSMSEIAKVIQELPMVSEMTAQLGVELKDMEQVLVSFEHPVSSFRASKPMAKLRDFLGVPMTIAGVEPLSGPSGQFLWKPDDRTLVSGTKSNVERWISWRQVQNKLTHSEIWKKLADWPMLVISERKVL